jgi:hypothetical protein
VRRAYRPKTPEGAANSTYVHFLFGLIFKYEGTTEKGIGLRGLTTRARLARADEVMLVMLQKLTEEIAECYEHARQCRERAERAVTSKNFLE